MDHGSLHISEPIRLISGCRVISPGHDQHSQQDVYLTKDGKIESIVPYCGRPTRSNIVDGTNDLIAPSLCHAHIHLDKCFLLSDPKFADLEIISGDFAEAMKLTSKAKERFEQQDLVRRGKWLVAESLAAGVTHMRAFVEVDHVVRFQCLDAAISVKAFAADACEIQICAFAQEPIYSGLYSEENRRLMEEALGREEVEVVGSTPYVEDSELHMQMNIRWATEIALHQKKHLDLHIDYNLDGDKDPLTPYVISLLKDLDWHGSQSLHDQRTISLGHCTRLTLLSLTEWAHLSTSIGDLPLHFIGLPTSDLFIQGKPTPNSSGGERPRGTLQIPQMIHEHGIRCCIAINNVGNAFTPYGSCDPLSIASAGVGIYHAGTKDDARLLFECVSNRAKGAIGYREQNFKVGDEANFVLFDMGGKKEERLSRRRGRKTLEEIISDPPTERKTIFRGRVVTV